MSDGLLFCKKCSMEIYPDRIPRPDIEHAAELRCPECGAFLGWAKKEKNIDKRKKSRFSPNSLGIDYCEICLRQKDRLGTNETLHIHHKIEVNEGGPDIRENILVTCTCCHSLIHHQRTYLKEHFEQVWQKLEDNENYEGPSQASEWLTETRS